MSLIPPVFSRRARERSRRTALQALYEAGMTGKSAAEILNRFADDDALKKADREYFRLLVKGVCEQRQTLETLLAPMLDRPLNEIDPVEQAVLLIGSYELSAQPDMPVRAVINEAIELAKMFGAEDSHKYVNGVLDKVAHHVRVNELAPKK